MRLGVLDVGSNTVHFLVVDAHPGAAPLPAHASKLELRLAQRVDDDGRVGAAVVDELCAFVAESLRSADDLGVTEITAFATSAVRDARTGEEEARLTFLAVRRWYGWSSGRLLVVDIGGGSLELAAGEDEAPSVALSLPLGAGRLTRGRFHSDPPGEQEVRELRTRVRVDVAEVVSPLARVGRPLHAVGTSKTFRQLARIAGAAPSSEGPYVRRELRRSDLHTWLPKLAAMTAAERALIPGVSEGRAEQLVAGAVVAEAVMDLLDVPAVEIAPWALREGVILRRLDTLAPAGRDGQEP